MFKELFFCTRTARKLSLKVNKAKGVLLLSRSLKREYPRNKLTPYKSPVLWKMQRKLFQNSAKLNTRQETVFKPNCVQRIGSFDKNCKKTSSEGKQSQTNAFIF